MSKRKDVEFALEFVSDYNAAHVLGKLIDFVFAQAEHRANIDIKFAQRLEVVEQSLKGGE